MCPTPYYTMIRSKNHIFDFRLAMIRAVNEHGIRATAKLFCCSRNTVRKWFRRFKSFGPKGLHNTSRRPNHIPHKTPLDEENKVVKQRNRTPGFSAARLKREFELNPSVGAIARIIRERCQTRKPKRKHKKKNDLRHIKSKYKPLTRFQMDTKYLNDMAHYWPYMKFMGCPKFQYTIRELRCGGLFTTYADDISVTYATLTVERFLKHLKKHKIDLSEVIIQTDKGFEFDGNAFRKFDRGFTYTVEKKLNATHRIIIKTNPNANADVESSHNLIEVEFFDTENFQNTGDFFQKIATYQHYFNLARSNSYKDNKTPLQILSESGSKISPFIFLLPPVNLDKLLLEVGHDVPVDPVFQI